MNTVRVKLPASSRSATDWPGLRRELGIVEPFSPEVLQQADSAIRSVVLPEHDLTHVPFFTLDPVGSTDLDQAMHLERSGMGFRVLYAIADVTAFVQPGSALDLATHERGETLYCPDLRVPLLPVSISENAASLLPGQVRPAIVWTLDLDEAGRLLVAHVQRATVRSTRQLDYAGVAAIPDDGDQLSLLQIIGELRLARARERGAVDIETAEQIVTMNGDGKPALTYRAERDAELWNAQISLLTGMAAAQLMLDAGVGVLRILPPPRPTDVESLRRSAMALGIEWSQDESYGDFVSRLDPKVAHHAAMLNLAARLLRGAAYASFDGQQPTNAEHSAVGQHYAHCTAPLRRLVDRYVNEICVAHCAADPIPQWVRDTLPALPERMAVAERRSHALERATIDLAEALILQPCGGHVFDGVVVDLNTKNAVVQIAEPAVRARCTGAGLSLGQSVRVRLVESDPARRSVMFEVVS